MQEINEPECTLLCFCQLNTASLERWDLLPGLLIHLYYTLDLSVCMCVFLLFFPPLPDFFFRSKEWWHFEVSELMRGAEDVLKCGLVCCYGNRTFFLYKNPSRQHFFHHRKTKPAPCEHSFSLPSSASLLSVSGLFCAEFSMMLLSPCGPPSFFSFFLCGNSTEQMLVGVPARGSCCCYEHKTTPALRRSAAESLNLFSLLFSDSTELSWKHAKLAALSGKVLKYVWENRKQKEIPDLNYGNAARWIFLCALTGRGGLYSRCLTPLLSIRLAFKWWFMAAPSRTKLCFFFLLVPSKRF